MTNLRAQHRRDVVRETFRLVATGVDLEVSRRLEGAQEGMGATQRLNDQARELYLITKRTYCYRSRLV